MITATFLFETSLSFFNFCDQAKILSLLCTAAREGERCEYKVGGEEAAVKKEAPNAPFFSLSSLSLSLYVCLSLIPEVSKGGV